MVSIIGMSETFTFFACFRRSDVSVSIGVSCVLLVTVPCPSEPQKGQSALLMHSQSGPFWFLLMHSQSGPFFASAFARTTGSLLMHSQSGPFWFLLMHSQSGPFLISFSNWRSIS